MARVTPTTRRMAIPPAIPMSMATAISRLMSDWRGSTSRSDVPAGSYWRQPDGYQPGEYHGASRPRKRRLSGRRPVPRAASYQTDGYRSAGYRDQTTTRPMATCQRRIRPIRRIMQRRAARATSPGTARSALCRPMCRPAARHTRMTIRWPAGPGGMAAVGRLIRPITAGDSAEPHRYGAAAALPARIFQGSEDRLAADTPISARNSGGASTQPAGQVVLAAAAG